MGLAGCVGCKGGGVVQVVKLVIRVVKLDLMMTFNRGVYHYHITTHHYHHYHYIPNTILTTTSPPPPTTTAHI